jgi:hypothetical protein
MKWGGRLLNRVSSLGGRVGSSSPTAVLDVTVLPHPVRRHYLGILLVQTPVVSRRGMWVHCNPGRIDMDDGVRKVRDVVEKLVVGDLGNLMRLRDWQCPVNTEPNLGQETVSHPTGSDLGHGHDAIDLRHCR